MNGELAQIVALASHGNAYFQTGKSSRDFYPSNSTFQFCKKVKFVEFRKSFFTSKQNTKVIANTPADWLVTLRISECQSLRLYFQYSSDQNLVADFKLAGMVGGGGNWMIEAIYRNYSDYWRSRWEVTDQEDPNDEIWDVSYILTSKHNKTTNQTVDLDHIRGRLEQSLTEIAEFALRQNLDHFAKDFEKAIMVLSCEKPEEGHHLDDLVVADNYSLSALQALYCAAAGSSVFGGMGSWNDLGFDTEEDEKIYDELSARLYDTINKAIIAVVNSY